MNQSFSKIWIIIIIIIFAAGGILAWQYLAPTEEVEIPGGAEKPYVKVVSPNGGEKWEVGETYDITWELQGIDKVYIFLGKKGASNVTELITENFPASSGKYPWTIPTNNADINLGGEFEIIISSEENNNIRDQSDNYFSIVETDETAEGKQEVTFEELISNPAPYNEKVITLEGFYFKGFEVIILAQALEYKALSETAREYLGYTERIAPTGPFIWIESLRKWVDYDELYQQKALTDTGVDYYGKVRVIGKFKYGEKYGHLGMYNYQITASEGDILEWSPLELKETTD